MFLLFSEHPIYTNAPTPPVASTSFIRAIIQNNANIREQAPGQVPCLRKHEKKITENENNFHSHCSDKITIIDLPKNS